MSFQIEPGAALDAEVRRVAAEQIDKAVAELSGKSAGQDADGGMDPHEAIHDVRKRFKKLRGLLRLVRAGDETFYRTENARYRDVARGLSAVRDRAALVESLDALEKHVADETATEAFAEVRAALEKRRDAAIEAEGDLGAAIEATLASLGDSRDAVGMLRFRKPMKNASAILAAGYRRTHHDARNALKRAERTGEAADFHLLRKQAKYLAAQLGLLGPLWPAVFRSMRDAAAAVGDDLGLDHDYAVFGAEVAADPDAFGERPGLDVVLALMDRRQAVLRERTLLAARRLLADRPAAAEARIAALYDRAAGAGDRRGGTPAEPPETGHMRAAE